MVKGKAANNLCGIACGEVKKSSLTLRKEKIADEPSKKAFYSSFLSLNALLLDVKSNTNKKLTKMERLMATSLYFPLQRQPPKN